jgi:hypothetical protein
MSREEGMRKKGAHKEKQDENRKKKEKMRRNSERGREVL